MSRFHIHAITLENFKSYAGCIRLHDISPGFVAIVGPNGCGKSNFMEALLFVLGRKVHHLRLNSSSDLIYRGSGPRPDHALVQVEFLRGSERVLLERKVLCNNSSIYRINGTEITLREAREHMKRMGINLDHEYFAVRQGQVEQLSTMKERSGYPDDPSKRTSEGLLEYFEGLIGTRYYHYSLLAMQNQLESTLEELPAALEGVQELKKRKREVKEQAKVCGLYLKRELDLYKVGNVLFQLKVQVQTASLSEAIETESSLSTHLSHLEEQILSLRTTHSQYQSRILAIRSELGNSKNTQEIIQTELEEGCVGPLEEKVRCIDEKIKDKKALLTQTAKGKMNLEAQVTTLTPALALSEAAIQTLTSDIREIQAALLELDSKTAGLREARLRLEQANTERRDSERTFQAATAQYNVFLEAKNTEEQHKAAFETERKALISRRELLRQRLKDTELQLEEGRSRMKTLSDTLQDTYLKRGVATKLVTTLQEDVTRRELLEKQVERSKYREQRRERIHNALRPLIDSGRLPDIIGRLGDLATVSGEFDIAISTLFAGPLNAYVALRIEAAEQLLQYCRDLHLGKITVYVVETIGENGCDGKYIPPEKTALRLFDLLKIDPFKTYLRKVFYQVMGNTLVANTLEEAAFLAFRYSPRPTVVTKTGDIIRASGEMQGHAVPLHGLIRTESTPSPFLLPEGSLSSLVARLQQQVLIQNDLEAQIQSLALQSTRLSTQDTDLTTHLSLLRTELRLLDSELHKPLEPNSTHQQRLGTIDRDLNRLKQTLEEAKSRVESTTETCLHLQADLDSRRNPDSQRLSERLASSKVLLERTETEHHSRFQDISNAKAKIEACNHTIYRLLREISRMDKRLSEMTGKLRQWESEQEKKMKKLQELASEVEDLAGKLKEIEGLDRDNSELLDNAIGRKTKLTPKLHESRKEMSKRTLALSKTKAEAEEIESKLAEKSRMYEEMGLYLSDKELQIAGRQQRAKEKGYSQCLMEMVDNVPIADFITPDHPYSEVLPNLLSLQSVLQAGLSPTSLTPLQLYNRSAEALKAAKTRLEDLFRRLGERREEYERLRVERRDKFSEGFSRIRQAFKDYYKLLLGEMADADIEFVDIADPFSSGLRISVRPPCKSWKVMKVLSGGERTLVSLSLILAFHEYRPNAIYLLDEIDAALDFVNVQKIAELIRQKAEEAQFFLVSLNIPLIERADQLIGVYKEDIRGDLYTCAIKITPPADFRVIHGM